MSIDFKIESICDHLIHEEQLAIDTDLKTLRIPRELASRNVTLYVNGFNILEDNTKFGWTLQSDETAIYTKRSKLVFKNKRKSMDDFYSVSYAAIPKFCPKCKGLRVHNDESYTSLGKLRTVQDEEKLLQEVRKGIATHINSNPFHRWIGTAIYSLIGSKVYDRDLIKAKVIEEVSRYLDKYVDIQIQQSNYQEVTPREAFGQILLITMEAQEDIDISYWILSIIFSNSTGSDLLYERKIDIPDPKNLLYGPQQPNIQY